MIDLETFIHDMCDTTIFRMFKYKRVYTPHEMAEKYSDESEYENGGYAVHVYIRNAIELPDGDVLLKLEEVLTQDWEEPEETPMEKIYRYEKLSDIVLYEYEVDNKIDE